MPTVVFEPMSASSTVTASPMSLSATVAVPPIPHYADTAIPKIPHYGENSRDLTPRGSHLRKNAKECTCSSLGMAGDRSMIYSMIPFLCAPSDSRTPRR